MATAPQRSADSAKYLDESLLRVRDLKVTFPSRTGGAVHALNGVDLEVRTGETLGIVGESGCGKSTLTRAIMRLLPGTADVKGSILWNDLDLLRLSGSDMQSRRGRNLALVFQDATAALNPLYTIEAQIVEVIREHAGIRRGAARRQVQELLRKVGLPDPARVAKSYPHQLSGGMRQRALIAMAVSGHPKLLIADEPTSAVDVTVQAQILDLLKSLRNELGMAMILVSHNLGVIAGIAQRVQVIYAGYIVEEGSCEDVLLRPKHPYTEGLIGSVAALEGPRRQRLRAITGSASSLEGPATACPFAPRCRLAREVCWRSNPPLVEDAPGHAAACWVTTGAAGESREGMWS